MNKIPTEIQGEILEHCDLSAAMNLRDTCVTWRDLCSESVLAAKVKSRVPWMIPGEPKTGLQTWALCARVVLARRKACDTGRLERVDLLDRIPDFKAGKVEYLTAENATTLPQGYRAVFDSVSLRSVGDTDPQLLSLRDSSLFVRNYEALIDLHTLDVKPVDYDVSPEEEATWSLDETRGVYTCDGCDIELPEDAEAVRFYLGKQQMVVYYDIELEE